MIAAIADPATEARTLINRDYISYSAISTYQRCPLKFFFRYVEQLPEESVAASLVFGSAIHACAEYWFNALMAGNPTPDLDTLLYVYQESWQSRDGENVSFNKTDSIDSLGQLAEKMLMAFLESDFAAPSGHIVGVEEELRGDVLPGCPELLARLDLITETEDDVVITDLKTSRSRWSQQQVQDSADQLLLYSELARELVPGKPLKLRFVVVTKGKNPTVDHHFVSVDPQRIARIKKVAQRVWQAVQSGHFYPSPSAMNCSSCGFREACRQWQG